MGVMKEFEVKKILWVFFSALFNYMDEGAEEEVRRKSGKKKSEN